ncbi:MAG: DMT family transporter [Burkholderiales bacterium]|nr:DMT family transporter [Burkholderiales bacterium]
MLLIVTDGNLSTLKFSPACLVWGCFSALFATAYSIQPKNAVSKAGAIPVLAWGSIVGGTLGSFVYPPVHLIAGFTIQVTLAFAFIVVIGTMFAFWCYLSSLKYISPVLVGLVVTLEPLSAFVFSILILHESLGFFQALGIACIVTTVFVISLAGINLKVLNRLYRQKLARKL